MMPRAFGADDGKATRTPAAWMILLALPTNQQQNAFGVHDALISIPFPILFPAWVTSAKRYWVSFA
jgi:hypothetical protein